MKLKKKEEEEALNRENNSMHFKGLESYKNAETNFPLKGESGECLGHYVKKQEVFVLVKPSTLSSSGFMT